MSKILTALSRNPDATIAVSEIFASLNRYNDISLGNISCVVFFVSSMYDAETINNEMNHWFANINIFGCTTAGELSANYLAAHSIVAMGFTNNVIENVRIEVIEDITNYEAELPHVVRNFENHFATSLYDLDRRQYFGLMLLDGLVWMEEQLLDAFGEYTNIELTGGSAGDDLKFKECIIFANGACYRRNAGVIAILKSAVPFGIECYQHFNFTNIVVQVTKVDADSRIIYELDGKPAAVRYAELLNVPVSEANKYIITRPFGFNINGRPFIRSVESVSEADGSLRLFCSVLEGTTLTLLEANDIMESSHMAVRDIKRKYNNISGILVFNCILRYLEILQLKREADFAKLFDELPVIGFCSYGEYYIGFVNQTMTVLVLE